MSVEIQSDFSSFNSGVEQLVKNLETLNKGLESVKQTFSAVNIDTLKESFTSATPAISGLAKSFESMTSKMDDYTEKVKTNNATMRISTRMLVRSFASLIDTVVANKAPIKGLATMFGRLLTKLEGSEASMTVIARKFLNIANNSGKLNDALKLSKDAANNFAKTLNNAFKGFDLDKKLKALKRSLGFFTKEVNNTVNSLGNLRRSSGLDTFVNANKNISKANKQLTAFNKHINGSISNTRILLHMAVYKIFTRLSVYIRQSVKDLNDFGKALAEIFVVAGGDANIDKLKSGILRLSKAFGIVKGEIAESVYQLISLRYAKANTSLAIMEDMIKGAIALKTELSDVVELVAATYNNYGKEVGNTDLIMSKFHRTIQLGKVRMKELKNIMGSILPVAKNLGISLDEVNALFATFTIKGLSASKAGTQIRSLFISLLKPSSTLQKTYEALGWASGEQAIKVEGLSEVLKKLNEYYADNSAGLAKALGRQRSITAFMSVSANAFKEYSEAINAGKDALENYLKVRDNPMKTQAKEFDKAVESLRRSFEQAFTQPFIDAVVGMQRSIQPLVKSAFILGKYFLIIGGTYYALSKIGGAFLHMRDTIRSTTRYQELMVAYEKKLALATDTSNKSQKAVQAGMATRLSTTYLLTRKLRVGYNNITSGLKARLVSAKMAFVNFGSTMSAVARKGRLAIKGLIFSVRALGATIKAAIIQSIIGAVILGIIYSLQKLVEQLDVVSGRVRKMREDSVREFQKFKDQAELNMERLANAGTKSAEEIRKSFSGTINELNDRILRLTHNVDFKTYSKNIAKANKKALAIINKTFDSASKVIAKFITKSKSQIEKLNEKLRELKRNFIERITSAYNSIQYSIKLIVNKRSLADVRKQLYKLGDEETKIQLRADKRITSLNKRKIKSGANVGQIQREIQVVKTTLDASLKDLAEKRKKLKTEIAKRKLFDTKKVPAIYEGLKLNETIAKYREFNALVSKSYNEIKNNKQNNLDIKKAEDYKVKLEEINYNLKNYDKLISLAQKTGLPVKGLEASRKETKQHLRDFTKQQRDLLKIEVKAEEDKQAKLLLIKDKFNKAYNSKDASKLRDIIKQAKDVLSGKDLTLFKEKALEIVVNLEKSELIIRLAQIRTSVQQQILAELKLSKIKTKQAKVTEEQKISSKEVTNQNTQNIANYVEKSALTPNFMGLSDWFDRLDISKLGLSQVENGDLIAKALVNNVEAIKALQEKAKDPMTREVLKDNFKELEKTNDINADLLKALKDLDSLTINYSNVIEKLQIKSSAENNAINESIQKATNILRQNINNQGNAEKFLKGEPVKIENKTQVFKENFSTGVNAPRPDTTQIDKNVNIKIDDQRSVNVNVQLDEAVLARSVQKIMFEQPPLVYA